MLRNIMKFVLLIIRLGYKVFDVSKLINSFLNINIVSELISRQYTITYIYIYIIYYAQYISAAKPLSSA